MATAAQLQSRIDALEEALATGVASVSHQGLSTNYRSVDEIQAILDSLKKQLAQLESTSTRGPRYIRQEEAS